MKAVLTSNAAFPLPSTHARSAWQGGVGGGGTMPQRSGRPIDTRVSRARTLRRDATEAEKKIWQHLRQVPFKQHHFRRQATIGPYFADFASHQLRMVIEVDGGQHSGSASDAKVPEFIEFIVKDIPEHQLPMRGGLRWLDMQCAKRYNKSFADCDEQQRIAVVDLIAYPAKAAPENSQGVAFFNRMRNLTATGFFTSKMGIQDLDYKGNTPNEWDGVPADVLQQYGYAYDEKTLATCLKIEDRGKLMTWD